MIAFEKSVGAIVFRSTENGLMFLILDYDDGYRNFPKGHMEPSETEEQTLRREIKEETGITQLKILPGFRKTTHYFYRAKGEEKRRRQQNNRAINIFKTVVNYLAKTPEENVILSPEHIGYAWLSYEDALKRLTYQSNRKILKKAFKILNNLNISCQS